MIRKLILAVSIVIASQLTGCAGMSVGALSAVGNVLSAANVINLGAGLNSAILTGMNRKKNLDGSFSYMYETDLSKDETFTAAMRGLSKNTTLSVSDRSAGMLVGQNGMWNVNVNVTSVGKMTQLEIAPRVSKSVGKADRQKPEQIAESAFKAISAEMKSPLVAIDLNKKEEVATESKVEEIPTQNVAVAPVAEEKQVATPVATKKAPTKKLVATKKEATK